jgi:hypothetical protein
MQGLFQAGEARKVAKKSRGSVASLYAVRTPTSSGSVLGVERPGMGCNKRSESFPLEGQLANVLMARLLLSFTARIAGRGFASRLNPEHLRCTAGSDILPAPRF